MDVGSGKSSYDAGLLSLGNNYTWSGGWGGGGWGVA